MASTVTELLRRRFGGKSLPYDAEVEYLENTSTSYIDTGIIPDSDTGISCVVYGATTDNFLCGLKDSNNGNTRWAIGNNGNGRYYYGYGITSSVLSISQNKVNVVELNLLNNKAFRIRNIDNTSQNSMGLPNLGFSPQNQIRLFGSSGVVASYTTWKGRIYSVQISQDQSIVMELIPVRVGTTGYMYDKVSGQLFGNAGTGDFILGNDI